MRNKRGFDVLAVIDASGSSYAVQEDLARSRMERAGVVLTTTNTALAELVQDWSTPQVSALIQLLLATVPARSDEQPTNFKEER